MSLIQELCCYVSIRAGYSLKNYSKTKLYLTPIMVIHVFSCVSIHHHTPSSVQGSTPPQVNGQLHVTLNEMMVAGIDCEKLIEVLVIVCVWIQKVIKWRKILRTVSQPYCTYHVGPAVSNPLLSNCCTGFLVS